MIKPKAFKTWFIHEPGVSQELIERIEEDAIPILDGYLTIEDFYRFATSYVSGENRLPLNVDALPHIALFLHAGRGDIDRALDMTRTFLPDPARPETVPADPRKAPKEIFPGLRDEIRAFHAVLATRDRRAIGATLRAYEEAAVRRNRLDAIWSPAPYPVERMTE